MSSSSGQNGSAAVTLALATLDDEMTETLAGFRRTWGHQGQPGTMRATFYPDRDGAQAEIRQVVRQRLAHDHRVIAWQ